jgi:hypothetical protein
MRVNPSFRIVNKEKLKAEKQIKVDKITRIVALVMAFISTFFFIIKILFL